VSNTPRRGSDSNLTPYSHGRTGHVQLATSVPPDLKDLLVDHCEETGQTMKEVIEEAMYRYLLEAR
jgi:hypothetical protein